MDIKKQENIIPEIERYPAIETKPDSLNIPTAEITNNEKETEPNEKKSFPETKSATQEKSLLSKLPFKKKKIIPPTRIIRDELALKVEKIMEEGIRESYEKLSPIAQQEFKIKGEETADKISELLHATKIKVKKIFRLILEWLYMLPGVNRFFLEQEAKIKTDYIIGLKNKNQL
ncbi:MAG: hypothetical protein COU29_03680 [Candidatus Magasanikbacteria bacterium CG10_big_fil_rev_8_21_14_0_10_36_32]|uniref:Uncharacterized protein n=1 Tax=Candidatus Magasanikbacteria bacterium CG10_big_fil_rev_8_21_14_0_10_36_32 TaxID=1974646 RepID=A0A2M6W5K4_9BACT|nr:MAG: hypothetical protein COU29_03680 [Candidatus Magasanikbacteria bacterium CG10_big_fil_rev_8_21_14_0_10_36_32]